MSDKLALVVDAFWPDVLPAESVVNTRVAQALVARGHQLSVYRTARESNLGDAPAKMTVHSLPNWGFLSVLSLCRRLTRGRYDRVILMYDGGGYALSAWIAWLPQVLRLSGFHGAVCVHFTNVTPPPLTGFVQRLIGLARKVWPRWGTRTGGLAAADSLVFYCDEHVSHVLAGLAVPPDSVAVSPVPATIEPAEVGKSELAEFRQQFRLSDAAKCVLFFGLLYPQKGVEVLLRASRQVLDRGVDHVLLVVGGSGAVAGDAAWRKTCNDYVDEMHGLAKVLALDSHCRWAGSVDDRTLACCMHVADLACFPFLNGVRANNSSFSSVAVHGIPAIATQAIPPDRVLSSPEVGVDLVPANDVESLAAAMISVLTDSERRTSMQKQIRAFHQRCFSMERFIDVLLGLATAPRNKPGALGDACGLQNGSDSRV